MTDNLATVHGYVFENHGLGSEPDPGAHSVPLLDQVRPGRPGRVRLSRGFQPDPLGTPGRQRTLLDHPVGRRMSERRRPCRRDPIPDPPESWADDGGLQ